MNGPALLAEFRTPERLLAAVDRVRHAGYADLDAYTPFAVEGLHEALGRRPTRARTVMLIAGVVMALVGFGLEWGSAVYFYPFNSGGRPFNSWQVFVIVPFYVAVLAAVLAGFLVLLLRGGMLRLHQPIFEAPGFERATLDRFFLTIGGAHSDAERHQVQNLLEQLGALSVREVEL